MFKEDPETQENSLTSIPSPYTLAANFQTEDMDKVIIDQFIKTLAEVAISVASRKEATLREEILDD